MEGTDKEKLRFKNISCYSLSHRADSFKNISCYSLSSISSALNVLNFNLKTSHVTVYPGGGTQQQDE